LKARIHSQIKAVPWVLVEGLLGIPACLCLPLIQVVFSVVTCRSLSARGRRDVFANVGSLLFAETKT
jgi:hypothetical protein